MTAEDERLVLCLCMKTTAIMEEVLAITRPPFDCTEDLLSAVEGLQRGADAVAKLVSAALVVCEN